MVVVVVAVLLLLTRRGNCGACPIIFVDLSLCIRSVDDCDIYFNRFKLYVGSDYEADNSFYTCVNANCPNLLVIHGVCDIVYEHVKFVDVGCNFISLLGILVVSRIPERKRKL